MATNIVQMTDGSGNKQYPVTSAEAVGMPDGSGNLQNYLNKRVTELNISVLYPTQGIGGTNKYDLATAIAQVPGEYRVAGVKVSFVNEGNDTETWEYKGGSWTVGSFSEVGARKFSELENEIKIAAGGELLIDKSNTTFSQYRVSSVDGSLVQSFDNIYVEIDVIPGVYSTLDALCFKSSTNGIAFMADETFLSGFSSQEFKRYEIEIPQSCNKIRYCYLSDDFASEKGYPLFDYLKLLGSKLLMLDNSIKELENDIVDIKKDIVAIREKQIDKSNTTFSQYRVSSVDGSLVQSSDNIYVEIDVIPGIYSTLDALCFKSSTNGIAFMADETFLSGFSGQEFKRYEIEIPQSCNKIRYCYLSDDFANKNGYPLFDYLKLLGGNNFDSLNKINNEIINILSKNNVDSTSSNSSMYLRGLSNKIYNSSQKYCLLVAGQSNTEGRVPKSEFPISFVDEDGATINYLNDKGVMENTMFIDKKVNGTPFAPWSFSGIASSTPQAWAYDAITLKRLQHHLQDTVYEIKWAVGSTSIAPVENIAWTPRIENLINKYPSNYDALILKLEQSYRLAKASDNSFEVLAVLWHQGEDDSLNINAAQEYYYNFKDVIDYIRGFVGNATLPFIFGTISKLSDVYKDTPEAWELINEAQHRLAEEDANIYLIDMSDGVMMDEGYFYHFDASSSIKLGEEMYKIIVNKIL